MSFVRSFVLLTITLLAAFSTAMACGGPTSSGDGGVPEAGPDANGAPFLTELTVSSGGGDELVPPYSPGIHDFYVQCKAGKNNKLSVAMAANPGNLSELMPPLKSAKMQKQTVSVAVNANDAIVAAATNGKTTVEYWVRCLPPDFPGLKWTVNGDAGAITPGYYLVGNGTIAFSPGYAIVLDRNGVPVWYHYESGGVAVDVDSLKQGQLSYIGDPRPVTFQLFDLTSPLKAPTSVVPKGSTADDIHDDIHDLRLTKKGYVVFSYPFLSGVDLTGLTYPLGVASADGGTTSLGMSSTIQDCVAVEFQTDGTVVSIWKASEHFAPADVTTILDDSAVVKLADGGVAYDVFHCNSIDVDPANDNYLISARHMDSVFYVEKPTDTSGTSGKVLWKMGGKNAGKDNPAYVSVPDPFFRQHDGRLVAGWQPDCHGGAGQVSVFDDESEVVGKGGSMPGARGVIYDVVVGTGGATGCKHTPVGTSGMATVANEYKTAKQDILGGSVRISPDGTRIVGWGANIDTPKVFSEFAADGSDLLDFDMPPIFSSYRAVKVPIDWFDLASMRATAGKP